MKHKLSFLILSIFCFCSIGFAQTIVAPDLQCVQNDNVNSNITLFWTNPPANPCGSFVAYEIYGSSTGNLGPYTLLQTVPNQAATFSLIAGLLATAPTWYFYIEASYNCPGATILQSDTVNNLNPITPKIVSVDVTPAGNVVFTWAPSPSPQTHCYIVYYYLPNGNAIPFDTICGRLDTVAIDLLGDPTIQSLVYTVAAIDSCGKTSAFNVLPHNTIFAKAATTVCQKQVNLEWNKYINWPLGVKEYQVLVSKNLGPFLNVGAVDSNSVSYAYSDFNDGDSLCVIIRAVSMADSIVVSNSNLLCIKPAIVQPPAYNYITNATVDLSNNVYVTWLIDTVGELTFYKIARSGNNVSYDPIAQLVAPFPVNQFETYKDSVEVLPQNNPYYYNVTAFDSCQNQYVSSTVKTVCLKGELFDYYLANLTWNDFELPNTVLVRHNLYRDFGAGEQLIRTFLPGVNSYSDSLQAFLSERGIFCYRIETVYDIDLDTANYQARLSSWSNQLCIIHRPIIYIPNAFAPNGVNNVFKPTIIYGEPKAYSMTIYNRFGGLVFESNDPNLGWDGNDHGKPAQPGGYAYLIQFYANDGVKVERKGMVLLVK